MTYSDNLKTWSATLKQYAAHSQLDWADICNKKALDLAIKCIQKTAKASPMSIKDVPASLGQKRWYASVVNRMKRAGTLGARAVIKAKRGARVASVSSWRYNVGLAARKVISRRLSAVGFLRSGWLPAAGRLSQLLRERSGSYGAGRVFSPKGYAVPAKAGFQPFSIICNSAASSVKGPGAKRAHDLIAQGATFALAASEADMRQYIERKIRERIRFFTGR